MLVARLSPDELPDFFYEMNANNFDRAMAYLTLVYRMNIPEEGIKRNSISLIRLACSISGCDFKGHEHCMS